MTVCATGTPLDGFDEPKLQIKWFNEFFECMPEVSGKNIAITGTTGTGFVAAKALAAKGVHVFLLNRASERAVTSLKAVTEALSGTGQATAIECDLQDYASVRSAAASLETHLAGAGLHVLINNAGVLALPEVATKDGFDVQMQTNHLSHFLLSALMVPALERAAATDGEARLVNHTSGSRNLPPEPLERKYFERRVGELGGAEGRLTRYHMSKLAISAFTFALQAKLEERGSKIKALLAHPGLCATSVFKSTLKSDTTHDAAWLSGLMAGGQAAEDGTLPLLAAAVNPDACSGDFYGPWLEGDDVPMAADQPLIGPPRKLDGPETLSRDVGAQKMLWSASEAAVGRHFFE